MAATDHDDPDNLTAALDYAARGWRVIPIPPGRKHPGITAWQREGTTDTAKIRHWWTEAPTHGIGIVTGAASRVWVLDVDVSDGKAGDDTLADLTATYGPLPDTYEVVTGSGGRHIYFAWPSNQIIRNDAGRRLGAGLDVRGEGGQVLAPPTIHPNGQPYEVEASSTATVAPAPDWLLALLAEHERSTEDQWRTVTSGERPGDAWAAATTWAQLLEGDGWTLAHIDRHGEHHWTRPGKDRREGTSATTGYKGSDVLKVFTSSASPLEPEETYTKFGYYAATRHGGDFAAATSALRDSGYGAAIPSSSTSEPWTPPRDLPAPAPLPEFPLETLPAWAQAHIIGAADQVQVPVDLTAMLAIGALSAAATGRARVHVSPNWSEPVNLYLTTAMRSGAGKSPADKLTVDWLRRWERDRMAAVMEAYETAQISLRHARKKRQKLEGVMGDASDVLAAHAEEKAAEAAVPTLPRLISDDATPEAVAGLLAAYGQRIAIMSTEADLFDMLLKGKPGQRANMNIYLKAWSGDAFKRDRKGSQEVGPESTELTNPLMTVAVTVQPSVLGRIHADDELVSRGFAARFMFAMPADLIGSRDQSRRFRSERLATTDPYEAEATRLASRWASWGQPADLRFSVGAAMAMEAFLTEIEPQLAQGEALEHLGEWANKLHGSVARYAGLLHLAEDHDTSTEVSAATAERAITLGRYWLAHAVAVLGLAADQTVEQAQAILSWAADNGAQFTLSDCQKHIRRPGIGLEKAVDYIDPIDLLIDLGWVRPMDGDDWRSQVGVRRAKSPNFALWPEAVGKSPTVNKPRNPRIALIEREILSLPPWGYTSPPTTRYADYADNDDPPPVDNHPTGSPPAETAEKPPPPEIDPDLAWILDAGRDT